MKEEWDDTYPNLTDTLRFKNIMQAQCQGEEVKVPVRAIINK